MSRQDVRRMVGLLRVGRDKSASVLELQADQFVQHQHLVMPQGVDTVNKIFHVTKHP